MANLNPDQKLIIDRREKNKAVFANQKEELLSAWAISEHIPTISKQFGVSTGRLRQFLKDSGVYNAKSKAISDHRQAGIKKTMLAKYGVENNSSLRTAEIKAWNSIPKTELHYIEDLNNYRKQVYFYTKQMTRKLVKPKYCYYTGIEFIDELLNTPNPNDYLKRCVDHKISVVYGYHFNISPEELSNPSNIVFCLRYINTIKGNSNADDPAFLKICSNIRERLIDEGHKHSAF